MKKNRLATLLKIVVLPAETVMRELGPPVAA